VAARFKAWIYGRLLAGNSARGMYVCLLWVLCVVRYRSLRRADHSSRGVLPSMVCLSVIVKPRQWGGPGPVLCHVKKKSLTDFDPIQFPS
jgi:hypothetical protein